MSQRPAGESPVSALIAFFETLDPESVARLPAYYAADAYFKDPFNEVTGVVPIQHIFTHLFRQLDEPRFVVSDHVVGENSAFLVWEMYYRLPRRRRQEGMRVIRGASHLKFAADGKVVWHRDYWDAAEELYATLPGIGWLMRLLQRKLAA